MFSCCCILEEDPGETNKSYYSPPPSVPPESFSGPIRNNSNQKRPTKSTEIPISSSSSSPLSSNGLKTNFLQEYELRDVIGLGSTSVCHKCIRKNDHKELACKVIDKRQVEAKFSGLLDQFYVEIKVLQMLEHPNIIKLVDAFDSDDRIYMVMETMEGGELFDYVVEKGTLSEEEASVLVRKITSAVAHMHNRDIIHRDLKPENLLLTTKGADAEIKLIDFGLAKIMNESVARSFLGTRGYLAPEMLQRSAYDKSIDVWALGIIVFVLLCGCLPFDGKDSCGIIIYNSIKTSKSRAPLFTQTTAQKYRSRMPARNLLYVSRDGQPTYRHQRKISCRSYWISTRRFA